MCMACALHACTQVGSAPCYGGCYVKLRALNVSGWEDAYTRPSPKVHTPAPPRAIPEHGARVELRMSTPLQSPRPAAAASLLGELAKATGVAPEQLAVVEVSSTGRFLLFDMLPPEETEGGATTTAPLPISDGLRALVASRAALEALPLDLHFGVRRQVQVGPRRPTTDPTMSTARRARTPPMCALSHVPCTRPVHAHAPRWRGSS